MIQFLIYVHFYPTNEILAWAARADNLNLHPQIFTRVPATGDLDALLTMLEPTTIYFACLYGCFLVLFFIKNVFPLLLTAFTSFIVCPVKAVGYCFIINRHSLFGPFTVASAFLQSIYIGGNIISLVYAANSLAQVASRAGTLCLANLAPLYLTTHIGFLADIFGLSLNTYQRFHRLCGLIAVSHAVFHAAISLVHRSHLATDLSINEWFPLIVGSSFSIFV